MATQPARPTAPAVKPAASGATPPAPVVDEFGTPPKLGNERPKAQRGSKDRAPNPLYDRVKACAEGNGPLVDGHTDGVMPTGTIARDEKSKLILSGNAQRAAALVRRAAADGGWKHNLRPLGPGTHQVGDTKVTVPVGRVALYFSAWVRESDSVEATE